MRIRYLGIGIGFFFFFQVHSYIAVSTDSLKKDMKCDFFMNMKTIILCPKVIFIAAQIGTSGYFKHRRYRRFLIMGNFFAFDSVRCLGIGNISSCRVLWYLLESSFGTPCVEVREKGKISPFSEKFVFTTAYNSVFLCFIPSLSFLHAP